MSLASTEELKIEIEETDFARLITEDQDKQCNGNLKPVISADQEYKDNDYTGFLEKRCIYERAPITILLTDPVLVRYYAYHTPFQVTFCSTTHYNFHLDPVAPSRPFSGNRIPRHHFQYTHTFVPGAFDADLAVYTGNYNFFQPSEVDHDNDPRLYRASSLEELEQFYDYPPVVLSATYQERRNHPFREFQSTYANLEHRNGYDVSYEYFFGDILGPVAYPQVNFNRNPNNHPYKQVFYEYAVRKEVTKIAAELSIAHAYNRYVNPYLSHNIYLFLRHYWVHEGAARPPFPSL
jgi:hypothetical protein